MGERINNMTKLVREHFIQLDAESGMSLDELKLNFRRLSFIWHPDRQPAEYRQLAEEKLQKINEAFEFFEQNSSLLESPIEHLDTSDLNQPPSAFQYDVSPKECPRCDGSGRISSDVDFLGRFVNETCPICTGQQQILVDERNSCRDCEGEGNRPHLHDSDREDWIDKEMRKRGWLERNLHPIAYKRMWLRFQREVAQCASCSGAGYFYYRHDCRQGQRRSSSPIDFLQEIQGSEHRHQDRRKSYSA